MANNFNEDFEYVIIKKLLSDPTYAVKAFSVIKDNKVLDKDAAWKVYKFVKAYFEKYNRLPNQKALDFVMDKQEDIKHLIAEIEQINEEVLLDEQFILDTTVDYVKRGLLKAAIVQGALDLNKPQAYGKVEEKIRKALEVSFDVYLGMSYRDDLSRRIQFSREYSVNGISTGLDKLNRSLKMGNGFLAKNIYIISAPSNLGKSIALCNFASVGAAQGKNVLFISLEMQETFIGQRMDSITTRIDINDIYRTEKEEELKRKHKAIVQTFGNADIMIKEYAPGSINIHTIRALAHDLQLYHKFKPEMIVVDYLNLMLPARKAENRYNELKVITEELRALSYEFDCPIITASQLNRGGYAHTNPDLDTMGESMAIVHTADLVAILSQTDDEHAAGIMQWHIKKNRLGPKDVSFPVEIDYSTLKISDFES